MSIVDEFLRQLGRLNIDLGVGEIGEKETGRFTEWLVENKIELNSINIAQISGRRMNGLVVSDGGLCKGQICIKVPIQSMITVEYILNGTRLGLLLRNDPLISRSESLILALYLLDERRKGSESKWKPYLDILPRQFSTPFYFDARQLELLKWSQAHNELLSIMRILLNQFKYVCGVWAVKNNQSSLIVSFDEFMWAISVVMTRQNRIPINNSNNNDNLEDGQHQLALIPGWDMANHAYGEVPTHFNNANGCLDTIALRDFSVGEEFLMCYGRDRSPTEFFLFSGFLPEDRAEEHCWTYKMRLSMPNDKDAMPKCQVLKELGIAPISDNGLDYLFILRGCHSENHAEGNINNNRDFLLFVYALTTSLDAFMMTGRSREEAEKVVAAERNRLMEWINLKFTILKKKLESEICNCSPAKDELIRNFLTFEIDLLHHLRNNLF